MAHTHTFSMQGGSRSVNTSLFSRRSSIGLKKEGGWVDGHMGRGGGTTEAR